MKTKEEIEEDLENLGAYLQEAVDNVVGLVEEYREYGYAEVIAVMAIGAIASKCSKTKVDSAGLLETAKYWLMSYEAP